LVNRKMRVLGRFIGGLKANAAIPAWAGVKLMFRSMGTASIHSFRVAAIPCSFWIDRQPVPMVPPGKAYLCRPKAGNAGASLVSHAGVNDPIRSGIEEHVRQSLARDIALRNWSRPETKVSLAVFEMAEFSREICEEIAVFIDRCLGEAAVPKKAPFVEGHLRKGGFEFNSGIPGASAIVVESTSAPGVGESGVDDPVLRNALEYLSNADCQRLAAFRLDPLICDRLKLVEICNDARGERQCFQDAFFGVSGRDQSMGIPIVDNFAESQSAPASAGVQQASNLLKSRYSRSERVGHRGDAVE